MAEPRVLLLDPDCFTPYYDLGLGQALADQGWAVDWITSRYHYGHLAPSATVRTREVFFSRLNREGPLRRFLGERPLPRRALKALCYPLDMARFTRSLAGRDPGVLHAQWFLAPWLDARLARSWGRRGWKLVYTVHDPRPLAGTGLGRAAGGATALYRACRALVAHDEWARDELIRAGAPRDRVRVLPPGPPDLAEPPRISQAEARGRLGLPEHGPVALFFGLIKPYKGLEVLLEAWPRVERRLGPAHLLVGGAFAAGGAAVRRRAAALGLDPRAGALFGPVPVAPGKGSVLRRGRLRGPALFAGLLQRRAAQRLFARQAGGGKPGGRAARNGGARLQRPAGAAPGPGGPGRGPGGAAGPIRPGPGDGPGGQAAPGAALRLAQGGPPHGRAVPELVSAPPLPYNAPHDPFTVFFKGPRRSNSIVSKGQKWILAAVSLVVLLTIAAFHLQASQQLPFDHDEQLHIPTGVLLLRQGLLPYQDYPFHHQPYLAPALAALFSVDDHLLSVTRTFNAACGAALVALVYVLVWSTLRELPFRLRLLVSAATAVYMGLNALFVFTSGRADNHDASLLPAFGAFLLLLRGMRRGKCTWFALSGVLLGLATGVRLTMLPLAGAMLLAALFPGEPRPAKARLAGGAAFLAGLAAALAPALALMAGVWERSLFYHFIFNPQYNSAYWLAQGGGHATTILEKLGYLLGDVTWVPGHYPYLQSLGHGWQCLPLLPFAQNGGLLLGLLLMLYFRRALAAGPWPQLRRLTLWTLALALAATLASTPSFYQYFYPLLPFGLILLGCGWAALWRRFGPDTAARRVLTRSLAGFSLAVLVLGSADMAIMTAHWAGRDEPTPGRVSHQRGREIRSLTPGGGKVLTLAPVFALEGGLEIYPRLAAGPFFWRVAGFMPPELRRSLNILGPQDLESSLAHDPPAAILTGFEGDLEKPLLDYARGHGYRPRPLAAGGLLHLPGGGR